MLNSYSMGKLLEAGCGYGRLTPLMKAASPLILLDREIRMVKAVQDGIDKNGRGVVADLAYPPFQDAAFDTVACIGVLMHVPDPSRAIDQLAAKVKPGGRFLLSWNNRWSPWSIVLNLWGSRSGALRQSFLGTKAVCRQLQRLGFTVKMIRGDSLIPLAATLPFTNRSLWPAWFAKLAVAMEKWPGGRWFLSRQGYELFALAQREDSTS
ncbi:MAG: class I SAM-dependent methyltransferase [Candidatus Omnitrophica bacterium]|nr:class I SAM-dependent methyltransferase [Candidatus Omnitrophota bacterium]